MKEVVNKILSRNGNKLEHLENEVYKISQTGEGNKTVKLYLYLSICICIVGLLGLYIGSLLGIVVLISSVPLFLHASKQKANFKSLSKRTIELEDGKIKIIEGAKEAREISLEIIDKLNYFIDINKNLSRGEIEIVLESGESIVLLEIFGDDKRYVEDDTIKVVNFISDVING